MIPTASPQPLSHRDTVPPAVNHANGVARLMGDGALYARVLARFRKEYRQAAAGIRGALDAGDLALAQRLAHTLKGAAGMIEAVQLREEAHALEQALRHGAGDPGWRLVRLERALERVLHELDAADGMLQAQPPMHAPPPAAQQGAAARLHALLEDGNGDAVDLVQEAAENLAREWGEERYRHIAAAIEVFDFEGALALMKR